MEIESQEPDEISPLQGAIEPDLPKTQTRKRSLIIYFLPVFYILGDITSIFVSFLLAFEFRFSHLMLRILPLYYVKPEVNFYLNAVLVINIIWIFIFWSFGHYKRRSPSAFDRLYEVVRGVVSGSLITLAISFFYRGVSFSRVVQVLASIFAVVAIWLIREIIYRVERGFLKKGIISRRAVFVGSDKRGIELFKKLAVQPAWGIIPLGFVSNEEMPYARLGTLGQLEDITRARSIDLVIFNLAQDQQDFITDFVMKNENLKLEYMITPDILGLMTFNAETGQIDGMPVLRWGKTPIEGYARVIKRIFDTFFSGIGLLAASPVMLAAAIAVKLDSPGPVLFKQRRVGRNGREFTMLKYRSMRVDLTDTNGTGWTVKDDPRRTHVGRFIRRYNIDELPQLFNVLMGQMSLVGPRPEQPGYVEKFKDDIPRYFQRHKVKSGVTGWAQVNGFRGDTSIAERTKYDLYYVENWSPVFDIKIILLTLKNVFKSPNAY
jgi:exopolysaccharide biosynthesis polyprenyl glycosylphosphotransferase